MQAGGQAGNGGGQASALWRHIRARAAPKGADPVPAAPVPRPPDRAIAAAIGRAAERVHRLPLFFERTETGRVGLAELPELLPDRALLSVVQGPGGALGVVAIGPGLLASVIEIQAIGRVSARPTPDRRPTRTDGALCVDFVNACLSELAVELAGHEEFTGIAGYGHASHVEDPRPLGLLLEDQAYLFIQIHLRAGDAGQRDSTLMLALPAPAQSIPRGLVPPPPAAAAEIPLPAAPVPVPALGAAVREVPITWQGVLCRRMIPLGKLRALAAGDLLPLPRGALDMAVLETTLGQPVLRGRLGQAGGCHALRILPPAGKSAAGAGLAGLHEAGDAAQVPAGAAAPISAIEPPMDDLETADSFRTAAVGTDDLTSSVPGAGAGLWSEKAG